jgi:hypothetical protein
MSYYLGLTENNKGLFLEAGRMELKVGDTYKCPENHEGKIVAS